MFLYYSFQLNDLSSDDLHKLTHFAEVFTVSASTSPRADATDHS
jgi:hypothetical protein